MDEQRYAVQLLVVRELEVSATDELQAERQAYQQLADLDRNASIAILVQPADEADGGALQSEDNTENWLFAREHFAALDDEWCAG